MSVLPDSFHPRLNSFHQCGKKIIQRITEASRLSRRSAWFINRSGNFAVRAHVVSTTQGLRIWLTFRRGWHSGEYIYSHCPVFCTEGKVRRWKAYRLACQQAEHLAHFRYRFQ